VICPGFERTPLPETQIHKNENQQRKSEDDEISNVMLKDTVDATFTTVEDIAQTALFLAAFPSAALTGQSIVVSHGWFMQ
jgi:3-hydroxybutyrate dehydrogenase